MEPYPWIVLLHIAGAFVFAISHGVSAFAAFAIRAGRGDAARVRTLLEMSGYSLGTMYVGFLMLLVGGIWAGIYGGHFARGWIWAALVVLVVITGAMYAMASRFYARVRQAVGLPSMLDREPAVAGAAAPTLDDLLENRRPEALVTIGGVGLLVILWLMVMKPF
jgi:hypothetical protein